MRHSSGFSFQFLPAPSEVKLTSLVSCWPSGLACSRPTITLFPIVFLSSGASLATLLHIPLGAMEMRTDLMKSPAELTDMPMSMSVWQRHGPFSTRLLPPADEDRDKAQFNFEFTRHQLLTKWSLPPQTLSLTASTTSGRILFEYTKCWLSAQCANRCNPM